MFSLIKTIWYKALLTFLWSNVRCFKKWFKTIRLEAIFNLFPMWNALKSVLLSKFDLRISTLIYDLFVPIVVALSHSTYDSLNHGKQCLDQWVINLVYCRVSSSSQCMFLKIRLDKVYINCFLFRQQTLK